MAQKDVELRLRARDDASKNVKKVSDSLKAIEADAGKAAKGAVKAGSALGGLAADVARLQSEANRLKSFGNIATQLDRSTAAVERSERALRGAQGEFARLAAESSAAAAAATNFRSATEAQAAALTAEKSALAATRAEQTKANAVVRQAEKDQLALNAARSQRVSGNRASAGVGIEAGASSSSARASMGAFVEADLANARARQAQLNAEVKRYADAVDQSTTALKQSKSQTTASAREQASLAKQVERAGNALLSARADAAANWRELEKIDGAANKASAALGGLSINQDDIARASAKAADQLARQQRALEAYRKFSTGGNTVADPQTAAVFQRQAAAVQAAKDDLAVLRAETTRLGLELKNSSGNVTSQVDALKRMSAATRAAEAEVQKQIVAMNRLRGVTQGGGYGAWARAVIPLQQTTAAVNATNAATAKLVTQQGRLAPATQRSASAMRGAAGSANQMGAAVRKAAGDKRQALSITQRLRGEVLALATAYLGLQSALGTITQSINAFRSLEAVQSRLGAVFEQDTARVASEVDFLRGQADRLGISFASLGEQYGKFAIAANSANFSAENTRRIFLSVAEAGRVNKLSLDQLNGTFLAIEQIISKGKFTSEEVRRQLGDRLPGAFNILADAMGVTTAELDKMMSQGDLLATESNLLKFANEMTSRFGPQLGASLDTLSTDIGRFENNLFKIQLALANGFIPELRNALQSFNDFSNSAEGSKTFAEIGATVGRLIAVLAQVPQYFDEIVLAAKAFAAIKLGGLFTSLVARVLATRTAFVGLGQQMALIGPQMQQLTGAQRVVNQIFSQGVFAVDNLRARLLASTAATGAASAGTRAFAGFLGMLRGVMIATGNVARLMWSAIGGLPGIIATGIVFAIGSWLTGIDDATTALTEHERQLAAVREAYQLAGEGVDDWAKTIKGVTLSEAEANLGDLTEQYQDRMDNLARGARGLRYIFDRLNNPIFGPEIIAANGQAFADDLTEIVRLVDLLESGELTVDAFRIAMDEIYQNTADDRLKEAASALIALTTAADEGEPDLVRLSKAMEEQQKVVAALRGETVTLLEAIEVVDETFDRSAAVDTYTAAIETLKEAIPELAEEMKRLKEITDLNKAAWEGMTAAFQAGDYGKIGEIVGLWARAAGAVAGAGLDTEIADLGSGASASVNLIKQFEGFIAQPKWDVNAMRVGYGSDTVTLSDGSIQKVVEGMTVTRADSERDLARRIVEFQNVIKGQIGEDRYESFNDTQRAVLDSIAYNYGSLPDRIIGAVMGGDASEIANSIRALSGDNDGVNAGRRSKEALIFERGGNADTGTLIEAEAERLKTIREQNEATQERIADTSFEIEQQRLINAGREKQAAIEEAIRAAKAENPNISEAELNTIREQTAALYDQQNARAGLEAAEERVNHLYQLRQQLLEQQKMAEENGDFAQVATLKEQIAGLNEQTAVAIQQAIAMWQAIGGPEADAAIAKLQTMGMTLKQNSDRIVAFGLNANQISTLVGSAVDGIVGIFDSMAQAIANGENAIQAMGTAFLQFAADFLRQIAMMILKQMLLNALAGFGGPIGQAAAGLGGIAGHTGGLVGANSIGMGNPMGSRPQWMRSAFTYHSGGVAGFKPDEVSATLKRGEEILTEEDPRHRFNAGGEKNAGGDRDKGIKQILVMNEDQLANAMSGAAGEKVVVTHLKQNISTLRQMLK